MTPLSYSLPAFQPGGYEDTEARLNDLKALGFEWVTFTPTYLVYDEVPIRIDPARGSRMEELRSAIRIARQLGLRIQLDPHLDFETTLTGGPYEWRRRIYCSPKDEYLHEILYPLAAMDPDALTLGSELDVALAAFAEEWCEVRQLIRGLYVGHKLNHDSLNAGSSSIREALNAERTRHGEDQLGWWAYRQRVNKVGAYLSALDFVSFSFYPNRMAGTTFSEYARQLGAQLEKTAGKRPCFAIGEFGLGSSDVSRPWYCDAATFGTAEALGIRRRYYLDFLEALTQTPDVFGPHAASFWTVGHFDFLDGPFRDEELRAAVQRYNKEP